MCKVVNIYIGKQAGAIKPAKERLQSSVAKAIKTFIHGSLSGVMKTSQLFLTFGF